MPGPVAGYNNPNAIKLGLSASPTNVLQQVQDVDVPLAADMYDATIMSGGGWKAFVPGLRTGTLVLKLNYDHTDTNGQVVVETAFVNGTLVYFIATENNSVNTQTFSGYIKDYKIHSPVNGKVDLDVTVQISAAVVFA
jgi:hypothetical protein